MAIDEEILFESETETKDIESIRKKFEGQMYLDPTYDPAFKALFDSEEALKDFLDGVLGLEGEGKIKTLRFNFDKALVFRVPHEKKVVFDIFATTGNNRFFNIEMQRLENNFFIDRTILYKAFHIIKGRKDMELSKEFKALSEKDKKYRRYELPECISVWICNFDLPHANGEVRDEWGIYSTHALKTMAEQNKAAVPISEKNKYIGTKVQYMSPRSYRQEVLPLRLSAQYIFLSVPNFKKSIEEIDSSIDKWLYLLNHAKDGKKLPSFGSEIIQDAIERIKVENASDELLAAQEANMTTKEDYESWAIGLVINASEKAMAKGRAEGFVKGHDEGLIEGRAEGRKEGREEGREQEHLENQADTKAVLQELGVSEEKIAEMQTKLEALRQKRLAQK